jgi:hypothetical protein
MKRFGSQRHTKIVGHQGCNEERTTGGKEFPSAPEIKCKRELSFNGRSTGLYRLQAEAPRFKKLSIEEVRSLVDTPIMVDLPLEIGEISVSIKTTAVGEETLINTQDATIGHNFQGFDIRTYKPQVEGVVPGSRSPNVLCGFPIRPKIIPSSYR